MTLAGRDLQGLARRFGFLFFWLGALAEKLSNSKLVSSRTYIYIYMRIEATHELATTKREL